MPRQSTNSNSSLEISFQSTASVTMRKFLIFVALCAVCNAAPTPADIKEAGLTRPSPINPDVPSDPKPADKVVLLSEEPKHRQKRDEAEKPHSVQAHEGLQHNPHAEHHKNPPKPLVLPKEGHEALQHDHKKVTREAHHEAGHVDSAPEKPHSALAREGLVHNPHTEQPEIPSSVLGHEALQHDHKKVKRESPTKPAGVAGHDAHAHHENPPKPLVLPKEGHEALQHDHKKVTREAHHEAGHDESAPEKPHSVQAREGLQHNPHNEHLEKPEAVSHAALVHHQQSPPQPLKQDPKKLKRESHHEHGHEETAPEKPHSAQAHDALQHNPHSEHSEKPAGVVGHEALQHDKKLKRESPVHPFSLVGHEVVQQAAHHESSPKPLVQPKEGHEALQHDHTKIKREAHHEAGHDESAPEKPHAAQAHDALQHDSHKDQPESQHDPKKLKRESPTKPADAAGHEAGHDAHADHADHAEHGHHAATAQPAVHVKKVKRESPTKPADAAGHEAGHDAHDAHADHADHAEHGHHAATAQPAVHVKKVKRESPTKPADAAGHEAGHDAHDAHADHADHAEHGHHAATAQPAVHVKKVKRESHSKPADAIGHEDAHAATEKVEGVVGHDALQHDPKKVGAALLRHQRDIPVPTQIKSTPAPKDNKDEKLGDHVPHVEDHESNTPHSPLRHHPVPVAELFNKAKSTAKPSSSSEESKESKEEDKA